MSDELSMNKSVMIIVSLVVFITGLAFGNFAGSGATGGATTSESIVTVEPYSVFAGEGIAITVIPGPAGIDQEEAGVYFYKIRDDGTLAYRIARIRNFCDYGRTCYESGTVYYSIPTSWSPGKYGATVKERGNEELTWGEFRIKA